MWTRWFRFEFQKLSPNPEVGMSTSLVDHAVGIRGDECSRIKSDNGEVVFAIHQGPETDGCSACRSVRVISRGQVERRFLSQLIGGRERPWSFPSHAWNAMRESRRVKSKSPR
jgi:hypothetical protein